MLKSLPICGDRTAGSLARLKKKKSAAALYTHEVQDGGCLGLTADLNM